MDLEEEIILNNLIKRFLISENQEEYDRKKQYIENIPKYLLFEVVQEYADKKNNEDNEQGIRKKYISIKDLSKEELYICFVDGIREKLERDFTIEVEDAKKTFDKKVEIYSNIDKINDIIDKTIRKREEYCLLNDEKLTYLMERSCKTKTRYNLPNIDKIVPMSKEEIIKLVLDFFKDLGEPFYKEALRIILNQNKAIKANVYNKNTIEDFSQMDENQIEEYTPTRKCYY